MAPGRRPDATTRLDGERCGLACLGDEQRRDLLKNLGSRCNARSPLMTTHLPVPHTNNPAI